MLENFYNQLAPFYKYLYPDWEESLVRQAVILDGVIREYFGDKVNIIRDVACGIGTQSLGLADLGYQVTGSDLSPGEIQIAKREARSRNLDIDFSVTDMREIEKFLQAPVDLIIACDNAIPHLLSKEEILDTFTGFYNCIVSGGGCIITVRDYAAISRKKTETRLVPRRAQVIKGGRIIIFDLWEFDGDIYDLTIYFLEEMDGEEIKISTASGGRYYCIEIDQLENLFLQAGFKEVITIKNRYNQPLLLAQKI